jgi:XTP/dITP diphosphohydrolase
MTVPSGQPAARPSEQPPNHSPGRLVLLATSPRVAPGLLTLDAWEALRTADRVFTGDPAHPQLPALQSAGIEITTLAGAGPAARGSAEPAPGSPSHRRDEAARWADELLVATAAGHVVVWLSAADGDPELGHALARLIPTAAARGERVPDLELLPGSYDLPGARLLDLVRVMDRLRSPAGCPWDAEQTHRSLVTYLIEEAYELVEAIETGDRDHLREELGDLLLQVVFHSRIAEEDPEAPWSIDEVAGEIAAKLIRRHPHVFGDAEATTAERVTADWENRKAAEKGRTSAVEGVPLSLPALVLAAKLLHRAAGYGLTVARPIEIRPPDRIDNDTIGDLLFAVAGLGDEHGIDPEQALRDAVRRFAEAVRASEVAARQRNSS